MQRSRDLEDEELRKVAELFLQHLIEKRPELKNALGSEKDKETVLDSLVDVLKNMKPGNSLSNFDLADKNFMQELVVALTSAVKTKSLSLDSKNDPLAKIKKLLDGLDPTKKLDEQLSPEKMKELKMELKKLFMESLKELKEAGLISMKPSPDSDKQLEKIAESLTDQLLTNQNIFGLLTPGQTGGQLIVVLVANGTRDYPDLNPNQGFAQIDRVNNPHDDQLGGDYLGINAATKGNYLQFEGDQFADEFQSELRGNGLAAGGIRPAGPGQAPK